MKRGKRGRGSNTIGKRSRVRRHFNALEHIASLPEPTAQAIIDSSCDDLVEAIGELCRNLLNGNIPIPVETKASLCQHAKDIRKLLKKDRKSVV